MSRKWTARKTTAFDPTAVDPAAAGSPYPVFRAGPDRAAAGKEVLRLLTGFTLLGLPVHCGIGWLAGNSLGLAAAAVLVTVAATLAVAVARWLGLDELLQRLPLLLVLGLAGVGLVFVTSLPARAWGGGGMELFGSVLILITVVSVLGGLYRPLAAAYQTVTLKVPFRDLCVAAAAMLVSLALAAANQTLPKFVPPLLACFLAAGFAGLVVTEYAAWARANPRTSLDRVRAFDGPATDANGKPRKPAGPIDGWTALLGAALFGLSYGLVTTLPPHAAEWHRVLPPPAEGNNEEGAERLATLMAVGLIGLPCGWVLVSVALNAFRFPNPVLALRVAWDALAVFLTYPETAHPLAHRLHTPWLRPLSVRLAGAGVVLVTAATAFVTPPAKSPAAATESKPAATTGPASPPPGPWHESRPLPQGDIDLARIEGRSLDGFGHSPFNPPPPAWLPPAVPSPVPPAAPESRPLGDGVGRFLLAALVVTVGGPVFLYVMVLVLGAAALPTYFNHFEKAETPAPPR